MNFFLILYTVFLAFFSTAVMSYITMATPIGPWIAPTLVLITTIVFRMFFSDAGKYSQAIIRVVAGGSIGGIIATAAGFSFPTLFFLQKDLFESWMAQPVFFCSVMSGLSLVAGGLGLLLANVFEHDLIVVQALPFPIGQLIYKMIAAQNQVKKATELMIGFVGTVVFALFQGAFRLLPKFIPESISLIRTHAIGTITIPSISVRLDLLPMLLAIGFVTGHVIAVPLAIGALSKIFFMEPMNALFFAHINPSDFVLAFCSGLVLAGAVQSFLDLPKMIKQAFAASNAEYKAGHYFNHLMKTVNRIELAIVAVGILAYFAYFRFSMFAQLFVVVGSIICAYQIIVIAGKIGLAQLGRFATFVMVPAWFIFGLNAVQVTLVATFVELCGGVATDVLFGRKLAHSAGLKRSDIFWYQLIGLIASSLSLGIIFWLLISHFGLGSEQLFAQRAQARALLINVHSFDIYVLALGGLFGLLLKKVKVNPMMVLGGLLMPLNYSLSLIAGGMLTFLVADRESWEPFWSGVFAANSIVELLKTII